MLNHEGEVLSRAAWDKTRLGTATHLFYEVRDHVIMHITRREAMYRPETIRKCQNICARIFEVYASIVSPERRSESQERMAEAYLDVRLMMGLRDHDYLHG